tara:strand:+ start:141 stop:380 length:240 start_codon:yes stop_codon:yes gene_type:complete
MNLDVNKISSNTKNIVFLIMLIGEGAWLVFSIHANEKEIQLTEKRSQKRYDREMKKSNDHEKRIRIVEAFMNYSKGNIK